MPRGGQWRGSLDRGARLKTATCDRCPREIRARKVGLCPRVPRGCSEGAECAGVSR
jgi:hypothetical protein